MSEYTGTKMAILFDSTRCTACKGCQIACKQWNDLFSPLGFNAYPFPGSYQSPKDVDGETRLIITFNEKETEDPYKPIQWAFGRKACFHCTDAGCVDACPSGALKHEENGAVSFNEKVCIGCELCQPACPFDIPRYHGKLQKIDKCDLCYSRLENGEVPACVKTCQPEALMFGPRDEMIAEGKRRVEFAKSRGFKDAELYGEKEMGGLHVLTVCKYNHEAYGLPTDPSLSAATKFIHTVSKPATAVAAGVTVAGLALSYFMTLGYKKHKLTVEQDKQTWNARQKAFAEELVQKRLAQDNAEYQQQQEINEKYLDSFKKEDSGKGAQL